MSQEHSPPTTPAPAKSAEAPDAAGATIGAPPSRPAQGGAARRGVSLSEFAYRTIYDQILARTLQGGDAVVEGKLAEALAISRTPLREALGRLEGEGLLLKGASRSFSVRSVSAREFFESLKVRETLESEAAELAAGRVPMQDLVSLRRQVIEAGQVPIQGREHWLADNRLHATVAVASGNAVLAALVRSLRITTQLFEIKRPLARVEADRDEHLAILEALAAEDGAKARRAMRRHLRNLRADVMLLLSGD